jgi:thioredoxin reductase (NADPH)
VGGQAPASYDVAIVGAGPIGIECAILAKRAGLSHVLLDQGPVVAAVSRYPTYMLFFTTSERLEVGGHPLVSAADKPTRKEALDYYRKVVANEGLNVRQFSRVVAGRPPRGQAQDACFELRVEAQAPSGLTGTVLARRVVVATGYFDNPNLLGVPGEDLPWVSHYYTEGHPFYARPVVIVGGGSSAADAALDLYRAGAKVTIVHRGEAMKPTLKYWIRPNLENRIKEGSIAARFGAVVRRFEQGRVVVAPVASPPGEDEEALPADQAFVLTGYAAPTWLIEGAGVEVEADTRKAGVDPTTYESTVPGLYVVGSAASGNRTSEVFVENGLVHARAAMADLIRKVQTAATIGSP